MRESRRCAGDLPEDPLLFEPGTRYRFSTYGWMLLSAVVEAAAGEPLPMFMTREILEPLGMESTVLEDGAEVQDITPAEGVDPTGRKIAEAFTKPGA